MDSKRIEFPGSQTAFSVFGGASISPAISGSSENKAEPFKV